MDKNEEYKKLKNKIDLSEALIRLYNNPDFKLIFLDKLFKDMLLSNLKNSVINGISYGLENNVKFSDTERKKYFTRLNEAIITVKEILNIILVDGELAKDSIKNMFQE